MKFQFNENNTFCISVEGSARWERISKRFDYFGMRVTKWPAVCCEADLVDNFAENLSLGQRGCAQSHINIWRHILETNLDYALILEDDAMFDFCWKNKLATFDGAADGEWDAIFLNASEPLSPQDVWVCVTEQYLTAGYIISRRGVERLLWLYSGVEFAASDWMTTRLQLMGGCYSYFPWLIIQEGLDTSIGSHLEEDHLKVINCLDAINYSAESNYV